MKRILVMGVSAGSGKSTFARQLGEKLNYPVTHLDSLYFEPGWKEVSQEVFVERQADVTKEPTWIIEGNYSRSLFVREARADAVIYLELPLYICLVRVLKRRITYHGQTRPDMGEQCLEKLNWSFLKYILTTYGRRKGDMRNRMDRYANEDKNVFSLNSRKQIQDFLDSSLDELQ